MSGVGTSGQVLTSGGAGVLPTWASSSGIATVTGQIVTATGAFTYTPTASMKYVIVELLGAGGGSGGVDGNLSGPASSGTGGAGAYAKFILTAAQVGASLTGSVGAGGAGGAAGANNGSAGGNTTLATTAAWTAAGGALGLGTTGTTTPNPILGGSGGTNTTGTGTILVNMPGGAGGPAYNAAATQNWVMVGKGGDSFYGSGAKGFVVTAGSVAGTTGTGYGSGAGSAYDLSTNVDRAGGAGANGIAIFTEFC